MNKNLVSKYLIENNIDVIEQSDSDGLKIRYKNSELCISGSKTDLICLADLLVECALENTDGFHFHIDDLTLLSSNSEIRNVVIEKI